MLYSSRPTTRSLSDLGGRSEEVEERGQIFTNLRRNSGPMQRKFGDIWTVPPTSAVDSPKSDRLLGGPETSHCACASDSQILVLVLALPSIRSSGSFKFLGAAYRPRLCGRSENPAAQDAFPMRKGRRCDIGFFWRQFDPWGEILKKTTIGDPLIDPPTGGLPWMKYCWSYTTRTR